MNHSPTLPSAFRCETGAVRERNEDTCLIVDAYLGGSFPMDRFGLYLVADGMGGQSNGHIASDTAARTFAEYLIDHVYRPLLRGQGAPDDERLLEILESGVIAAHEAVLRPEPEQNGGTTLTAALILGEKMFIAHVGDTRAYLLTGGELRALTKDHSLVRKLQERGKLSAEEAHAYQYRNILLQALGQESALEIDTFAVEAPPQSKLLLCSDGLCGFVAEAVMLSVMNQDQSPQELADRLYEEAMAAGGTDNITAVVVNLSG